jgi:hypothetical protein
MSRQTAVILSEDRNTESARKELEARLTAQLMRRTDVELTIVPHLYDLSSDGPATEFLQSIPGDMVVLSWLYARSAYWILHNNGIRGRMGGALPSSADGHSEGPWPSAAGPDEPDRTIWCLDLRAHRDAQPHLDRIARILATGDEGPGEAERDSAVAANEVLETTRQRWYPVIDFDRCTNCLECLNFCLFGVFSVDDRAAVLIDEPDACRAGCPACSRICPAGAIIFPQHNDPAISGDPSASRGALKLDLSQLMGGGSLAEIAAAERDRALAGQQRRKDPSPSLEVESGEPSPRDRLDRLVDQLDEMEL